MNVNLKKEEYTALADFVMTSFIRDQSQIMLRFPKLNETFLADFNAKLEEVKTLESVLVLTEEQKKTTTTLNQAADSLNNELNFLISYSNDADLNSEAISNLKKDLTKGNIEGAVFKIEGVKQYVQAHNAILEEQGMAADFAAQLEAYKTKLQSQNVLQYQLMNSRKSLTKVNIDQYKALYAYVVKILNAGKLIFNGTIIKQEYTLSKVVGKLRSKK